MQMGVVRATARTWMQTRRSDSVSLAILWVTAIQFSVGVAIVISAGGAQGPSAEMQIDRLENKQASIDSRVYAIEQLRLPERLAVLEKSAQASEENWTEVRRIGYGLVTGIIGLIAAQIVQIRGQSKRRGGE